MQPVADLHFLQVAQPRIELFQRQIVIIARCNAGIGVESDVAHQIKDLCLQQLQPPRIMARGLVKFINQRLEIPQRPVAFGPGQRRRQMVDDHSRAAPLGLCPLARIIDDERIDMRHRAEHRFRITRPRQGQRLARQPFEIAVFAHMDDRMGVEMTAQPGIEGKIAMRRHQIRRVITGLRIDVIAARRLDADHHIAKAQKPEPEGAVPEERVVLRRTPALADRLLDRRIEPGEKGLIIAQGQLLAAVALSPQCIGRTGFQRANQRIAI